MIILEEKKFEDLWNILPEFLLRRRLERACKLIKPVIKRQLAVLDEYKKSANKIKYDGHIYVFNTVEDFWDKAKLAFSMGGKKSMKNFTFYPVRTCIETLMRFMYFCRKSQSERDIIAIKELLRIYNRLYKIETSNRGLRADEYAKAYGSIANGLNISDINCVKDRELDPFPDMASLCRISGIKDPLKVYFLYQCLCEDSHGKMIATVIRYQSKKFEPYRRSLMLLVLSCKEMLILVDKNFLDTQLKNQIESCIEKVDAVVKQSMSFYERSYLLVYKILGSFKKDVRIRNN